MEDKLDTASSKTEAFRRLMRMLAVFSPGIIILFGLYMGVSTFL